MGTERLKRRAYHGLACQRVLDNTHVHALRTGFGTQLGHLRHRDTTVFGSDHGLRIGRNLRHFLHQRFLVFEVQRHLIYSPLLKITHRLTACAVRRTFRR